MTTRDIMAPLQRGERLLLDGGTGSELQRRGVNVSKGITPEGGNGAWSGPAMEDAPAVVQAIHEDYLRAGAEIITANSYNTNRGQLARVGLAHKMEAFSRLAIEIACAARDRLNPAAFVAGSIAPGARFPFGWDPARVGPADQNLRDWSEQAAILADAGADCILIESMSSIAQLLPAVEAASMADLPVFLGMHPSPTGTTTNGETMDEVVAALKQAGLWVDAILLMCRSPEEISVTLPKLRAAFDGPIGAYANVGYRRAEQPPSYPERQYFAIDIGENTPERYARYGQQWLEMGAQIVGGCCATTPEHIAALRPVVHPR